MSKAPSGSTRQPAHAPAQAPADETEPPLELARALVVRARAGDRAAWTSLYRMSYRPVFRRLCYLLGDPSAAEDVAQEVFAVALGGLDGFGDRGAFVGWLLGIAHNLARKHWRSRSSAGRAHERMKPLADVVSRDDPERAHEQRNRAAMLYEIVDRLPDSLREVFVLRDLERVPARDIAAQLELTEEVVFVRACRARARVKSELAARGVLLGDGGAP
jgi:RNA polymerase sigma-70 factor (ECF subfamily)